MSRIYVRTGDFVLRRIADETILVPVSNEMADLEAVYTMSDVGREIWEQIDGDTPAIVIARRIAAKWQIDMDRAQADVDDFLGSLVEAGLIKREDHTE